MALRRQNLSPTANLLRNSRLFSLPDPLPRPVVASQVFGSGTTKSSDTATLPYPTHQAIATTPSSLARGDWGLKRPLPSRSHLVQSSKPVVRIKQLDTIEHVTDFESASDHVRTREKFIEMGTPIVRGETGNTDTSGIRKSAFEEAVDVTNYDGIDALDEAGMFFEQLKQNADNNASENEFTPTARSHKSPPPPTSIRWKHGGPWIPGMSDMEFKTYLSKDLSSRQAEFTRYLIQWVKDKLYTQRTAAFLNSSTHALDPTEAETQYTEKEKEWSTFTPSDISTEIRNLRRQCASNPLNSDLFQKLIIPFLRLPPMRVKSTTFSPDVLKTLRGEKFTDNTTPISTHPSAGLGYLRTKAYMANHPILGPQRYPPPIQARVIQPRQTGVMKESQARLGVAGFVTNDEYRDGGNPGKSYNRNNSDVQFLDIVTPGGYKLEVEPEFAAVGSDGRVNIRIQRRVGESVQVKRGLLVDVPPMRETTSSSDVINPKSFGLGKSGIRELDAQGEAFGEAETEADSVDLDRATKAFFENLKGWEEKRNE